MNEAIMIGLPWLLMLAGIIYNALYTVQMKKLQNDGKEIKYFRRIPEGLAYGMFIGAAVGYFLKQVQWGLGLGVFCGVVIGTFLKRYVKR